MNDGRRLEAAAAWAYSSVVEHCVDIAGVASSNLATPTIFFNDLRAKIPLWEFLSRVQVGCAHRGRKYDSCYVHHIFKLVRAKLPCDNFFEPGASGVQIG